MIIRDSGGSLLLNCGSHPNTRETTTTQGRLIPGIGEAQGDLRVPNCREVPFDGLWRQTLVGKIHCEGALELLGDWEEHGGRRECRTSEISSLLPRMSAEWMLPDPPESRAEQLAPFQGHPVGLGVEEKSSRWAATGMGWQRADGTLDRKEHARLRDKSSAK